MKRFSFLSSRIFWKRFAYAITGIALLAVLIASLGWYPILFVSRTPVYAFEYKRAYDLSYAYYSYMLQNNQTSGGEQELRTELGQAVLDGLIDSILVDKRLEGEMRGSELSAKIAERVNLVWSDPGTKKTLLDMTGSSEHDVRTYFLETEAKNEILDGVLRLEGSNLQSWLQDQHKAAHITILSPGLHWTEEGIRIEER